MQRVQESLRHGEGGHRGLGSWAEEEIWATKGCREWVP